MGTWIIGLLVFSIIIFAAYKVYQGNKTGGCDCSGCGCCVKEGTAQSNTCYLKE